MAKMLAKSGKLIALLVIIILFSFSLFACGNNNLISKGKALKIDKNKNEVLFGSFYQNSDKEKEDIKWIVLEKDEKNKKALLLSKYLIDCHDFEKHDKGDLTWDNSSIKAYLQNDFYKNVFNENEKLSILDSDYGTVFLLSIEEVEKYDLKSCSPTRYAESLNDVLSNSSNWWLRSNGAGVNNLAYVDFNGKINYIGASQDTKLIYLRPAIWVSYEDENKIDLNKSSIINKKSDCLPIGNIGDIVKIGKFETDIKNKKSDIEWIIINKDEDDGKALLLSRFGLEYKKFSDYNVEYDNEGTMIKPTGENIVTWENSPLRKWLNEEFYNQAFDNAEKKYIISTEVKAEDDIKHSVNAGNDTIDKIFLLSLSEAENNISNANWLKCMPTKLMREKINSNKYHKKRSGVDIWWLRNPEYSNISNTVYNLVGESTLGSHFQECLVRPAMWINYKDKESEKISENVKALKIGEEGSIVGFGKYQSNRYDSNTVDKIRWKVQYKDPISNKALLITEEIIDSIPYRKTSEAVTWDNSYIRVWLNQYFYDKAFSDEEKEKIIKTKLDNTNRASTGKSGTDTEDNVFLLSCDEVLLFLEDRKMSADVTKYGLERGLTNKEINRLEKKYRGTYMLRNVDETNHIPFAVFPEEYFDCRNDKYVAYEDGIRPAVWVYYEDTDKDLSCLYEPQGYRTIFMNLFYGSETLDNLPLTYNFLKKYKEPLIDEFKIQFHQYNEGYDEYLNLLVNEEEKTFILNIIKRNYESDSEDVLQTLSFDYNLDDNGFIDDIILKKTVINGEGPGKIDVNKGPIKDIEDKEETKNEKKETKNINRVFSPLPDVEIENVKIGIENADDLNIGNEVVFGKYIRSTSMEDIKWTIYEKDEDERKVFLISNQVLDSKEYDTSELFLPEWNTCTLRTWLNTDFYNIAFNAGEKEKIIETKVETFEQYREDPVITNDKIFILSELEVKKYFPTKASKRCWATPYSHAKGKDSVYWWLRNHSVSNKGKYVSDTGVIYGDKIDNSESVGIRPAMWVKY